MQRENILAQLAGIQRDVLRIAVILDIRGSTGTVNPPSKGDAKKDGNTLKGIIGP